MWPNEHIFQEARRASYKLVEDYVSTDEWSKITFHNETSNLDSYGYGSKSYVLSLIESALKVSNFTIPQERILEMLKIGKDMISNNPALFSNVENTLQHLSNCGYELALITKETLKSKRKRFNKLRYTIIFLTSKL